MKDKKSLDDVLTNREKEIGKLIAAGSNSKEVANKLHISLYTVKAHRRNIYKKLHCKNLMHFVNIMHEHNGIDKNKKSRPG